MSNHLSSDEVWNLAVSGFVIGFILDPTLYIDPGSLPPPPPPPPYVSGAGGGFTGAGNIAATNGNWTNVRPLWDFVDQQTFKATARGAIVIRGKTSVVVLPKTDDILALPWDQLRVEDEMLLGVINAEHSKELKAALETVDNMILTQDDLLLLLNGAYEDVKVDDEDVILFY